MASTITGLTIRARQHSDGKWTLTAHGYVDGEYRIERVDQVTHVGPSVDRLRWFFLEKYSRGPLAR